MGQTSLQAALDPSDIAAYSVTTATDVQGFMMIRSIPPGFCTGEGAEEQLGLLSPLCPQVVGV